MQPADDSTSSNNALRTTAEGCQQLARRKFLNLAAGAAAVSAVSNGAWAQTYPSHSVRLIVPFPPGGPNDVFARLIGQWLYERWGQPFIIDNRPGAGGNIGTEVVAKASPDGYTLLLINSNNAVNATLYDKLNYNFIRDIAPIAAIIRLPLVLVVNPIVPVTTVPEFIAHAKANPGKLNYASVGNGSTPHVAGELFKMMTGIELVNVSYRGAVQAVTDLLSGRVQAMFMVPGVVTEHIKAGKLRAVAVTAATRSDVLPDVPTVNSVLTGYEATTWFGIGGPKNMPSEIVDKLNKEINAALADPKIKARLTDLGGAPLTLSPGEFDKLIANDTDKWGKVIRAANIKPE
jgi:tripartite-type tricarboxylate transporter receptor subunit TctC